MNRSEKYRVVVQWSAEDQSFMALAPELGNCLVRASTKADAIKACEDAIERFLQALEKEGREAPIPFAEKPFSGKLSLRLDPTLHRDVAIRAEMEGVSINQFIEQALRESVDLRKRS